MTTTTVDLHADLSVADLIDRAGLDPTTARKQYGGTLVDVRAFRAWLIDRARQRFCGDLFFGSVLYTDDMLLTVRSHTYSTDNPAAASADIRYDGQRHTVTLATIEQGLKVIRDAVLKPVTRRGTTVDMLHNADTGERLHVEPWMRDAILGAERVLDAAGDHDHDDIDAGLMTTILQCGLYGRVL
jgi:hypothetical protein